MTRSEVIPTSVLEVQLVLEEWPQIVGRVRHACGQLLGTVMVSFIRSRAASLVSRLPTCVFVVKRLMCCCAEISTLVGPRATDNGISVSRGVS